MRTIRIRLLPDPIQSTLVVTLAAMPVIEKYTVVGVMMDPCTCFFCRNANPNSLMKKISNE